MAKINLVEEVLKHSDDEIIDYLYGLIAGVRRDYISVEDPKWLLASCGEIDQLYYVLKALKERNDGLKDSSSL